MVQDDFATIATAGEHSCSWATSNTFGEPMFCSAELADKIHLPKLQMFNNVQTGASCEGQQRSIYGQTW